MGLKLVRDRRRLTSLRIDIDRHVVGLDSAHKLVAEAARIGHGVRSFSVICR